MKTTVFVSGFARSGTTTMMRMLEAGGIPALADEPSKDDMGVHHTHGVYELHDVGQRLMEHPKEWTAGKAVKLVAQYMDFLPLDRPVKVVFMVRDINEIIASLLAMEVIWEELPPDAVRKAHSLMGSWGVDYLDVQYRDLTKYPRAESARIAEFLAPEWTLDVEAMAAIVDPANRKKAFKGRDPELVTFNINPDRVRVLN